MTISRTGFMRCKGGRPLLAVLAASAVAVAGCGGGGNSAPTPDRTTADTPIKPTPRPAPDNVGTGRLRNTRFAVKPIVEVRVCRARDRRKCFPFTYTIFARLTRKIPGRGSDIAFADFDIGGGQSIDPTGRLRRPRSCFSQALYTNSPAIAGLPHKVGEPITVTLEAFNAEGDLIGSLTTNVRLSKPEPRRRGNDYSPRASELAVGC
jgi:hypothetical protein